MSSVFSMEAEGISKFWKTKVMTKRPTARTVQMEASDSSAVSWSSCLDSAGGGAGGGLGSGFRAVLFAGAGVEGEASVSSAVSWSSCLDSAGGVAGVVLGSVFRSVFSGGVVAAISGNLGSPRLAWRAEIVYRGGWGRRGEWALRQVKWKLRYGITVILQCDSISTCGRASD